MLRASWLNIWGFEDIIRFGFGYRLLRRCLRTTGNYNVMIYQFFNPSCGRFWLLIFLIVFQYSNFQLNMLRFLKSDIFSVIFWSNYRIFVNYRDFGRFLTSALCWHAIMFNNMRVDLGLKHKPWSIIDLWISLWHSFGPNFA